MPEQLSVPCVRQETYDDGGNACTDCDGGYVSNSGSTVCTVCARPERLMMAAMHVLTVMTGMFLVLEVSLYVPYV